MSFKKYIDQVKSQQQTSKPLIKQSRQTAGSVFDRGEAVKIARKVNNRYVPPVDFATASNFAFYGSAKEYYSKAIDHIVDYYPYDGTTTDKQLWHVSSSFLENYIFENEYPRTNGYVIFSSDGWGTQTAAVGNYGLSSDPQYILFNGGLQKGNIVNNAGFVSNLQFGHSAGNCVEFWIKKSAYVGSSLTTNEVVLDIWNSSSAAASIGKFSVQLDSGQPAPLYVQIVSGTTDVGAYITSILSGTLIDSNWHHVALNVSYGASATTVDSYLDGAYQGSDSLAGVYTEVTGNFVATLGSLVSEQPDSSGTALGYGKLSASLDDFRFWRGTRTGKQIGVFVKQSVNGGAATGSTNINLGVYYKFNEGITTNAATDKSVLDFSGRLNNGTFVGYSATSRSTASAFVQSGLATREVKDPILYKFHPLVVTYTNASLATGSFHDEHNINSFYHTLPDWITSEDQEYSEDLKKLTQIMASALDELYLEIKTFPLIQYMEYYNDKTAKTKFAQHALNSRGFIVGRILEDETALATMYDTGDQGVFVQKLEDIKKVIYSNLYNNSTEIFKTKGTVESLRNALRCFGVDNELINLSLYEDNSIIQLDDKRELYAEKYKFINFSTASNNDAVVFPSISGSIGTPFISGTSGTADPIEARTANTYECQVFLPKYPEYGDATNVNFVGVSSSIFGVHGISATSSHDNTTTFHSDDAGFQVYAVRDNLVSKKVKFVLTSSVDTGGSNVFPALETGFYSDAYDNETWTLAVTIKPVGYGLGDLNRSMPSGPDSYVVNFRGVNVEDEMIFNSFSLTSSMNSVRGIKLLSQNRKPYYGANRINFTGSVQTNSDLNIGFFRVWLDNLADDELISHAKDPRNAGRTEPYNDFLPLSPFFSGAYVPQINSLIMNLGTDNLSTSNAHGEFTLDDLSSGSYKDNAVPYLDQVLGSLYQGKGYGFTESSTNIYNSRFFTVGKTINPENFGDLTGVRILNEDDVATKSVIKAKLAYFMIEKSAQQAINRDIISFFSSLSGFNELIGNPINKYRMEYKELKKLATEYFSTVITKRTSAAFFEYYKWLDNSINSMLINLLPASLNGSDEIYNVVESHILERNKFQYRLPTIEFNTPDPEAVASGSNNINWRYAHAPLSGLQVDNCYWWKYDAERTNHTFDSDLPAGVLHGRDLILTASRLGQLRGTNSPVKPSFTQEREIHGGINFGPNKRLDYYKGVVFDSSSIMETLDSSVTTPESCYDESNLNPKRKLGAQVVVGGDTGLVATLGDGNKLDYLAPFNIYSASLPANSGGYFNNAFNDSNPNEIITNVHHDVFGPDSDQPLQGTFTSQRVGGSRSRKIRLSDKLTSADSRPERFVVNLTQSWRVVTKSRRLDMGVGVPIDQFYQDPPVRAPVNIKNIRNSGSAIGNFSKNYEVVQTSGRSINNINIADLTGVVGTLASPYVSGVYDYPIITGAINKTVFVERFSAPGGPDTAGGFLDPTNREFSVYNSSNNRNSVVRDAINSRLKIPMSFGGYQSGSNDLSASIHDVVSNSRRKMRYSSGTASYTSSISDNGWVSYGIPARDAGYLWITNSVGRTNHRTTVLGDDTPYLDSGFTVESGFATGSKEILFLSKSFFSSWVAGGSRFFGAEPFYAELQGGDDVMFIDFAGLNSLIYEPINGYRVGWDSYDLDEGLANRFRPTSDAGAYNAYFNFSQGGGAAVDTLFKISYVFGNNDETPGVESLLGGLLAHRGGPFGWCTWKQIRQGAHPVARYLRRINKISHQSPPRKLPMKKGNDFTFAVGNVIEATEPALTTDNSVLLVADLTDDSINNSTLFALPHNSQKRYFCDNDLEEALISTHQMSQKTSFEKFYDFYMNSFQSAINAADVKFIKASDQIYPLQKFSYLKTSLIRDIFVQTWKNSRSARSTEKYTANHADISMPTSSNQMSIRLNYGNVSVGRPDVYLISQSPAAYGNVVGPSISVLDTPTSSYLDSGGYHAQPLYAWADTQAREIRNTVRLNLLTASVEGTLYLDLRNKVSGAISGVGYGWSVDLPNSLQVGLYDPTAANNTRYGILRDPKSVLNRWVYNVAGDTGSIGANIPDVTRSVGDGDPLFTVSSSYGPLLEMPWHVEYGSGDNTDLNNTVSGVFNTSFYVPWTAPWTYGKKLFGEANEGAAPNVVGPSYYNDHKEYSEFVKIVGKDHSLIPEYRISERIETIVTEPESLISSQVNRRSLTGSFTYEEEQADDWNGLTRYGKGDVFFDLKALKKRFVGANKSTKISKLKLRVEAITKLLPYDGFYPAERTVQLAQIFSSSLKDQYLLTGPEGTFRTLMQPLFMPGILYNSIKAGLAMSYGMFTGSLPSAEVLCTEGASTLGGFEVNPFSAAPENVVADTNEFVKLPFEELVTLQNMANPQTKIVDMFPHKTMSLNSTASMSPNISPLFQMAMSNFLASTIEFSLKDNQLTTIESQKELSIPAANHGESYAMEIALVAAEPSLRGDYNRTPWDFTSRYGALGWGPSVGWITYLTGNFATDQMWRPQWATPLSTYNEEPSSASIHLEWNPRSTGKFSIASIQKEVTASFYNAMTNDGARTYTGMVLRNTPRLSESINYLLTNDKSLYEVDPNTGIPIKASDPTNTNNTVWVIQPKWETIYLSRDGVDGYQTQGIWKTFCEAPDPKTNGADLSIWIKDVSGKKSLKDFLKLPEKTSLGKPSSTTKIEEAIVCIPYYDGSGPHGTAEKQFFTTSLDAVEQFKVAGLKAVELNEEPNEWYTLSRLLNKYVFPPQFDFNRNNFLPAVGMLVQEYEQSLDEEDLRLWWQNLPPKAMATFAKQTSYLEIDLEKTEMFKGIEEKGKVQWLIFKVKKRAKSNYFSMTANNPEFSGFTIKGLQDPHKLQGSKFKIDDFNYNYPYDFCSLVETAKITAEVDFVEKSKD
jgi:hypothetical protein